MKQKYLSMMRRITAVEYLEPPVTHSHEELIQNCPYEFMKRVIHIVIAQPFDWVK